MRPVPFAYERPPNLRAAIECLQAYEQDATVLAGGQSLLPLMNRRLVRPGVLVDLEAVPGLRHVTTVGDAVHVGALATHADLERGTGLPAGQGAVLARVAAGIGNVAVRTMGTVGGTVALAAPVAEWCLVARLADAQVVLSGPEGERMVGSDGYFDGSAAVPGGGPRDVRPHEIVTEVRLPSLPATTRVLKASVRAGLEAMVAVAVAVEHDPDGAIHAVRIAAGGVGDRIVRAAAVEEELVGARAGEATFRLVAERLTAVLAARPDERPDRDHRIRVAARLTARAVAGARPAGAATPAPHGGGRAPGRSPGVPQDGGHGGTRTVAAVTR